MGKIVILGPQNRGVDMSEEAKALGPKAVASAVNCAWRNGVIGSRPRFRYQSLGISGCFQGASGYAPSFGLSAFSFADRSTSLITAVGGKLYRHAVSQGGEVSCSPERIESQDFSPNAVHLYQAENWLIAQSPGRNTHWWDGQGPAEASPGMQEDMLWSDPKAPARRICPEMPEANIPDCDQFDCDPTACTLVVVEQKATGATTGYFRITNSGYGEAQITAFESNPPGAVFDPPVLDIPAGTTRRVDVNVSGIADLTTTGVSVTVTSPCGSGSLDFYIPPTVPVTAPCSLLIAGIVSTGPNNFSVTLSNNGVNGATGIQVVPGGDAAWLTSPVAPINLAAGSSVTIQVTSLVDAAVGQSFYISSNCAPDIPPVVVPPVVGPECALEVYQAEAGAGSGNFTIANTGGTSITITDISTAEPGMTFETSDLPYTMVPGDSLYVYYEVPGSGGISAVIDIPNSCDPDFQYVTLGLP